MTQKQETAKAIKRLSLKWKIFISTVAVIFILLLIAIAILLSPVGLKIALSIIKNTVPGQLSYSRAQGKPLGPITFTNLSYTQDGDTFSAKKIYIDWQKLGFAKLDIWIKNITVDDAHLTTGLNPRAWLKAQATHKRSPNKKGTKTTKPWSPFWLRSDLRIDQININKFTWSNNQNKKIWSAASMTGNIDVSKKNLNSHIDLIVDFPSNAQVTLETQGEPDDYSLILQTSGPQTKFNIQGQGDEQHINLKTTDSKLWGGTLIGTTHIAWQPQLSWNLHWQAKNLNPTMIWENKHSPIRLPSNVTANIKAHGIGQAGQAAWDKIKIKLKQQTFHGQGSLTFDQDVINSIQTNLYSRISKIFIKGTYNNAWQLQWRLKLNDLKVFSNYLGGRASAKGKLLGKRSTPQLIGTLSASNIKWKNLGYRSINAAWDIDANKTQPAIMNVTIKHALNKNQILQNARLILSGTLSQHKLLFIGNTPNSDWSMDIAGKNTDDLWTGSLNSWNITDHVEHEQWSLSKPVPLSYDKTGLKIDPLQLLGKNSDLEFSANLQDLQNSQIHLQAKSWPLHSFQPWAPPMIKMAGHVTGQSDITIKHGILKKLKNNWNLSQGVWTLRPEAFEGSLQFQVNYATIKSHLDGSALKISVTGGLNKHSNWAATINLADYKSLHIPHSNQAVTGALNISSTKLHFLQTAIPDTDQLRGELMANCKISGTWAQPQLFGNLKILNGGVNITRYGVSLNKVHADIKAVGQDLNFKLIGYSQGKPITLKGQGTFENKNMQIKAKLSGDNVLIWDTDRYTFYATPDLNFDLNNKHLNLSGDVLLPNGSIHPKSFSSAKYLSEDTVIVQKKKQQSSAEYSFDSNINLKAGDNLQIDASGITGTVQGKLHVQAGTHKVTVANGRLYLKQGNYRIQGRNLNLNRGELNFRRSPLDNPFLNISATRTIKQSSSDISSNLRGALTVGVNITGTLKRPVTTFFSAPTTLTQSEILSYLTFGQQTASTLNLISQAVSSLTTSDDSSSGGLADEIQQGLDLNEFGFEPSQQTDPLGAPLDQKDAFVIGKNFGKRLYLRYSPSKGRLNKTNELVLRYQLNNKFSLQGDFEANSTDNTKRDYGGDLFYTVEKN